MVERGISICSNSIGDIPCKITTQDSKTKERRPLKRDIVSSAFTWLDQMKNEGMISPRRPRDSFVSNVIKLEWISVVICLLLDVILYFLFYYMSNKPSSDYDNLFTWILYCSALLLAIFCICHVFFVRSYEKSLSETNIKIENGIYELSEFRKEVYHDINKVLVNASKQMETLSTKTKNYIDYSRNQHISIVAWDKKLVISRNEIENGRCQLSQIIKIRNNSSQIYKKYIFNTSSYEGLSPESGYTISLDDKSPFSQDDITCHSYDTKLDGGEPKVGYKISIPVEIKEMSTSVLKIVENSCPSFKKLKTCVETGCPVDENISVTIRYPTEVLRISLILDESMKGYTFTKKPRYKKNNPTVHPSEHETINNYVVLDNSEQPVKYDLDELPKWGAVPIYSNKEGDEYKLITWEIHYPKVGYTYQLYFSLAKSSLQE